MFLHEIDARARPLELAADGRRKGEPLAVDLAEILDRRVDLAVVLDELLDRDVDLLLLSPLLDRLFGGGVGVGYPMVPETDRKLASSISAAHERCRDHGARQGGRAGYKTPPTHSSRSHTIPPNSRPAGRLFVNWLSPGS